MVEVVKVIEAELELLVELVDMIESCIEAEVEIVEAGVDLIVGCRLGDASLLPVAAIFEKVVEKLRLKKLYLHLGTPSTLVWITNIVFCDLRDGLRANIQLNLCLLFYTKI